MRLLIIDPIVSDSFDDIMAAFLKDKVAQNTQIEIVSLKKGPSSIETFYDEAFAAPEVLKIIQRSEKNFDGFLINCFADVGVPAARELTRKPVLGAGEGSFFITAMLGVPFSVVSIGKNARNKIGARLGAYGLANFRSAVGIELGVLDLDKNIEGTAEVIVQCAKQEMKQYGSEAILLGCTGMARAAQLGTEKLNVPVVEPSSASIKALECLVNLGLSHNVGGLFSKADLSKIKK